jgi:tRNA 2-thiouridine synthesizing protein B
MLTTDVHAALLHIVNRSPFESDALASCLRLTQPGQAILLIENAVVAALADGEAAAALREKARDCRLYLLEADLRARGLHNSPLLDAIEQVDYSGFVELVAACPRSLSWS